MSSIGFDVKDEGVILEIRNVIVRIKGLPSCAFAQPLTFEGGAKGMVIGFDKNEVLALLLDDAGRLKAGDRVSARDESLEVPVGDGFLGRVVNGLAEPCDGKEKIAADSHAPVFAEAPGIVSRAALTRQLHTGVKIIDSVIPIAKGQRELIIGDRVTGKTTLAVDAILNQKNKNVVCIYCCIGRGYNFLLKLTRLLSDHGAMEHTVIVASTADSPAGQQYLAPYTAACIGEHFMRAGKDVLVVFDDLTKHAWIYRQISLLMDRSPGREAYPGDIFYVHSQLVERAAQLSPELGGGSMTFLPIVETQQGDITGYISSNLISMTDGQIFLNGELFQSGFKPAVDLGLSVSRIGNKIQTPAMRYLCSSLRLDYVRFRELQNITRLRSNVSKEAQAKLDRGQAITEALKQNKNEPMDIADQMLIYYALKKGAFDGIPKEHVNVFKDEFGPFVRKKRPDLMEPLEKGAFLEDAVGKALDRLIGDFMDSRTWAQAESIA